MLPLSGPVAPTGVEIRETAIMLVEQANAGGGLLGSPIELVIADDAGKPEEGVNIARRFVTRDQVLLSVGSVTSPVSFATSQFFREAKVSQIVVTSTAQSITAQGNEWVFRSAAPDTKLGITLARFIKEKKPGLKRFATLYVNDDFGKGGADAFVKAGKELGFEVAAEERFASGDLDFTAQLTRIRVANVDGIVEWSRYAEAALVARQKQKMGMQSVPHFGSDTLATPKYLELAGDAAEGVIYPTTFSLATVGDNAVGKALVESIQRTYGKTATYNHAQAYDAVTAALTAIKRAGKADRTAVRDALRQTAFNSARGPFKFDQRGDPDCNISVVRIQDQKEVDAWSV